MILNSSGQVVLPKPRQVNARSEDSVILVIAIAAGLSILLLFCLATSYEQFLNYPLAFSIFMLTGAVSILGMMRSIKKRASMQFLSFFFSFAFMAAAPLVQVGSSLDPVFRNEQITTESALMGLAFAVTGLVLLLMLRTNEQEITSDDRQQEVTVKKSYFPLFVVTTLIALVSIIIFHNGLFSSREGLGLLIGNTFGDAQIGLIMYTLMFGLPFYGSVIGLCSAYEAKDRLWTTLFVLPFAMALVLNNPMVHPRFKLAGFVFFFIDYAFKGRKTAWLAAAVAVGIILAPMMQSFRTSDQVQEVNIVGQNKSIVSFKKTFLSYDYDAFQVATYTILNVERHGIVWGKNLLGAALTFVPRSWWPDKPEPTAYAIYKTMKGNREVGTKNLSTPLTAEGYYAFGWFGVILVSLLYWRGLFWLDSKAMKDRSGLSFVVRSVFAGLVLICLRGTLAVAVSACLGAFVASAVPWYLVKGRTQRTATAVYNKKSKIVRGNFLIAKQ